MLIVAAPIASGISSAVPSTIQASHARATNPGFGTAARRNASRPGIETAISAPSQASDPSAMNESSVRFSPGTRPNRRITAQPTVIVATPPMSRERAVNTPVTNIIAASPSASPFGRRPSVRLR